jgi:hypothetical protein
LSADGRWISTELTGLWQAKPDCQLPPMSV